MLLAAAELLLEAVEPQAAMLNTIEAASKMPINFFMCVFLPKKRKTVAVNSFLVFTLVRKEKMRPYLL